MLGDVNKLFVFKSLLTMPSNVLPLHLKQTFPLIIWIFTECEGDGIETRLPFKIFSNSSIEIILHKNKNSTQCAEQGGPSDIWCFFTESIPAGSLAHSSATYIVVVYYVQFHLLGMAIKLILLALMFRSSHISVFWFLVFWSL